MPPFATLGSGLLFQLGSFRSLESLWCPNVDRRRKGESIVDLLGGKSLLQVVAFENHAKSMHRCSNMYQIQAKEPPFQKVPPKKPRNSLGNPWISGFPLRENHVKEFEVQGISC